MKTIAPNARGINARGLFLICILGLTGCAAQRQTSAPTVYDFGPSRVQTAAAEPQTPLPPLVLSDPQASPALEGTAVLYRLSYADAQQLKPYALARWSTPPAQLIGQRLRQHLSLQRAVVAPGELLQANPQRLSGFTGAANGTAPNLAPANPPPAAPTLLNLRLELEEFSQLFDTPNTSQALLRLRATLTQRSVGSESLLAQRSFVLQRPAPTPDAIGGVRALTAAADAVVLEVEAWLAQVERIKP